MSHRPSAKPIGVSTFAPLQAPNTSASVISTPITNVTRMGPRRCEMRPRFQPACRPTAARAISGRVGSRKVGSKYWRPTESVPSPSVSEISGAIVPANTAAVATTSRMLLKSRKDSREVNSNPASLRSRGARHA